MTLLVCVRTFVYDIRLYASVFTYLGVCYIHCCVCVRRFTCVCLCTYVGLCSCVRGSTSVYGSVSTFGSVCVCMCVRLCEWSEGTGTPGPWVFGGRGYTHTSYTHTYVSTGVNTDTHRHRHSHTQTRAHTHTTPTIRHPWSTVVEKVDKNRHRRYYRRSDGEGEVQGLRGGVDPRVSVVVGLPWVVESNPPRAYSPTSGERGWDGLKGPPTLVVRESDLPGPNRLDWIYQRWGIPRRRRRKVRR